MSTPQKLTLERKVDTYRSGWTVVDYLAHRFPYHTAERWRERVVEGRVQVNGADIEPAHIVHAEDVVAYTIFHDEPEVDRRFDIVFEDDNLLVVSKSGNIPVHACGVYIRNTLITELRERYAEDRIALAHRLDRETSGCVILTKNKIAAREMSRQFAEGEVEKQYFAIVHGVIEADEGVVDAPIAKTDYAVALNHDQLTMANVESELKGDLPSAVPKRVVDFDRGKPALTEYRVTERLAAHTVVEVRPQSGRTNQIRVHMHHAGYPIVGDKVYRVDGTADALRTLPRHALHCSAMHFVHPTNGKKMSVEAPLPPDLTAWLSGRR